FIVQEIVPGDDSSISVYNAFWNQAGEVACAVASKLRQSPLGFGDGSFMESTMEEDVIELSRRFLRVFGFTGIVNAEWKRDGRYYLIEINARAPSHVEIARHSGVDLAWIAYHALTTGYIPPQERYQIGVRIVNEENDWLGFLQQRGRGTMSTLQYLGSLRGAKPLVAAWDDPVPLYYGARRMVKRAF